MHIDVHIFGGNATSSLVSSIYCVFRSLLAVFILIGFAYGGLTGEQKSYDFAKCNVLKEFNFINCLRKILMIHFITYQAKQENGSKRNQAVVVYRPEPPASICPHPPSASGKETCRSA